MTEIRKVSYIDALELIDGWEEKLVEAGISVADIHAVRELILVQHDSIQDLEDRIYWVGSQC